MYVKLYTIAVTTNTSGAYTGYTDDPINGPVLQIRYVPDGSNALDTGSDLDIVGESTGIVVSNKDNIGTSAFTVAPRQATHDNLHAASLYAAGGEPVEDYIFICGERLKLDIAQGGDTKEGTFYIWVG